MIVYKGRVFTVEVDNVALPNGRQVEMAIVRHPPSVVIVPVQDDGRVVLIRQHRHAVGRALWEFPAGSVDAQESAEAAARRECEEEIGQVPTSLERLGGFFPTPGYCDEEMILFKASGLRPPPGDSPHAPDDDEDIETHTMTVAEAQALVRTGEIVDLKTAYALTLLG